MLVCEKWGVGMFVATKLKNCAFVTSIINHFSYLQIYTLSLSSYPLLGGLPFSFCFLTHTYTPRLPQLILFWLTSYYCSFCHFLQREDFGTTGCWWFHKYGRCSNILYLAFSLFDLVKGEHLLHWARFVPVRNLENFYFSGFVHMRNLKNFYFGSFVHVRNLKNLYFSGFVHVRKG